MNGTEEAVGGLVAADCLTSVTDTLLDRTIGVKNTGYQVLPFASQEADLTTSAWETMQSVGRRYVQYFSYRYQRTGILWEGRYRATV